MKMVKELPVNTAHKKSYIFKIMLDKYVTLVALNKTKHTCINITGKGIKMHIWYTFEGSPPHRFAPSVLRFLFLNFCKRIEHNVKEKNQSVPMTMPAELA
jgi:hypothetical protein